MPKMLAITFFVAVLTYARLQPFFRSCTMPVAIPMPVLHQPNLHPYLQNATPVSVKRYASRRKLACPYHACTTFTFLTNVPYTHVHIHIRRYVRTYEQTYDVKQVHICTKKKLLSNGMRSERKCFTLVHTCTQIHPPTLEHVTMVWELKRKCRTASQ